MYSANASMAPMVSPAMYGQNIRGLNDVSQPCSKDAQLMGMFYGTAATKFGTDMGMAPTAFHEYTMQMLRGDGVRAVLQEALFIRRSLVPLKIGVSVLSPMTLVQALTVSWERNEDLPTLLAPGPERTTGRETQTRSESYQKQLERWVGGDKFGIDALLERPQMLDRSRAINTDALLSTLDINVWVEARRAFDDVLDADNAEYANTGSSSMTGHLLNMQEERFQELTFAFNRYTAPLTRITNQIEAWQENYGGAGNTWFFARDCDIALRNAAVGPGKEFEYFRHGPGAREAQTAGYGETLAAAAPSGKQVYSMPSVDIAGVNGLEVMCRSMTYGEFYIQGYPNWTEARHNVKSADANMWLMTVTNNKTVFGCQTLLSSLHATGMYDAEGKPVDIMNDPMFADERETAKNSFTTAASRRHSLYYKTEESLSGRDYELVRFMGQMEPWSMSSLSMLSLGRSVIDKLHNRHEISSAIEKLVTAKNVMESYTIKTPRVSDYLTALVRRNIYTGDNRTQIDVAKVNAIRSEADIGLKPIVQEYKEYERNNLGGWDLPEVRESFVATTADAADVAAAATSNQQLDRGELGLVPSGLGFELPPMSATWGMLLSIAAARARVPTAEKFQETYGLSAKLASDVQDGIRALETVSSQIKRLMPGSVFNDARVAPDFMWSPTDAGALYAATIGSDMVPLFHKGTATVPKIGAADAALAAESRLSELRGMGNDAMIQVQDRLTGRVALVGEGRTLIAANINAAADNAPGALQAVAPLTTKLAEAAIVDARRQTGQVLVQAAYKPAQESQSAVLAYRRLLALMFNTRPADGVIDRTQLLQAERNRALILLLAAAINTKDNKGNDATAEVIAERVNKFWEDIVRPAYGGNGPSMVQRSGSGGSLFGAADDDQGTFVENLRRVLTKEFLNAGVFTNAELTSARQQFSGIYEKYNQLLFIDVARLTDANAAKVPGEWRRTPLSVGRKAFLAFEPTNNTWLPADPENFTAVIQPTELAIAKRTTPTVFLRGRELGTRFASLAVPKHFLNLLRSEQDQLRSDDRDPVTGMTYAQEISEYTRRWKESMTNGQEYPYPDVMSGDAAAIDAVSFVEPEHLAGMVTRSFAKNWVDITVKAASALEEIVSKNFMGQVHNAAVFESAFENDTVFPMRFLGARFAQFKTYSALYAQRGGEAMQTPFTAPRFYQGSQPTTQEFLYNFHVWASPVVLVREYLYWADNLQVAGYYGGWTLNPVLPERVRKITEARNFLQSAGDLFVFVQPFEPTQYPAKMPITGLRSDARLVNPNDMMRGSEVMYENAYATEILFALSSKVRAYSSNPEIVQTSAALITTAVDRMLPQLHMGTARFYTSTGNYIQHASGPLGSEYVNEDLYKAFSGKDHFYERSLAGLKPSCQVAAAVYIPLV